MTKRNRAHYIFDDLIQKIEDNFWKEKDCLPTERELASSYQSSRNTIREVLKMLSSRGYITLRDRRPAVINTIPKYKTIYYQVQSEEFFEIQETRYHLEGGIADRLVENITKIDIEKLEAINEKIMRVKKAEELARLDYEFHLSLISIAKNNFLRHLYLLSMGTFTNVLFIGKFSPAGIYAAHKTHADIIEALKQKNKELYLEVLDIHFKIGADFLETIIKKE